jgi:hypothetical protein
MTTGARPRRRKESEWSFVRLTLAGKYLDPDKVSDTLGIRPDISGQLGQPSCSNPQRMCKQGSWTLEGKPSHGRIETQMKNILKRIAPAKRRLKTLIQNDESIVEAYVTIVFEPVCGTICAAHQFSSQALNGFTSLGLDVIVTVYPPQYDEE